MDSLENRVVKSIHDKFDALPAKSKPRTSENHIREWVPLSGIAIVKDDNVTCISIGTGMKCLPACKLALFTENHVLHDWHAEVLAIRAFNNFLIEEANRLASSSDHVSNVLRRRAPSEISPDSGSQPFTIHEDLRIMMYCSEAPCGDASMELIMEAQEDATPWPVDDRVEDGTSTLLGRGSFSQLGIVRRKPARADGPPTLSKSCSDKLALKQCTSLLSSVTSLLVSPVNAYIHTLIIPHSQYREVACSRSFGLEGRMKAVAGHAWKGGYAFRPFKVQTTTIDFTYSRRSCRNDSKGCNVSAVWTPHIQETLINGVTQGRKQTDLRGASMLSSMRTWTKLREKFSFSIAAGLRMVAVTYGYRDFKRSKLLEERRRVKHKVKEKALKAWEESFDYALEDG